MPVESIAERLWGQKGGVEMSTIPHAPAKTAPEKPHWSARVLVAETWASLAIGAMWLTVAVASVWGPDLVTSSSGGSDSATIPSGIIVAMFATIGTWFVAKYGFAHRTSETD
jgi:hypothetical protein